MTTNSSLGSQIYELEQQLLASGGEAVNDLGETIQESLQAAPGLSYFQRLVGRMPTKSDTYVTGTFVAVFVALVYLAVLLWKKPYWIMGRTIQTRFQYDRKRFVMWYLIGVGLLFALVYGLCYAYNRWKY